jgi:hypothetical protein
MEVTFTKIKCHKKQDLSIAFKIQTLDLPTQKIGPKPM